MTQLMRENNSAVTNRKMNLCSARRDLKKLSLMAI